MAVSLSLDSEQSTSNIEPVVQYSSDLALGITVSCKTIHALIEQKMDASSVVFVCDDTDRTYGMTDDDGLTAAAIVAES